MKPYIASLFNALILIILGLWGYFGSVTPSATALIPVTVGIILLATNTGLRKENKAVAHVVVMITLIMLIALIKPLTGAIGRGDSTGIFRVVLMQLSCVFAMIYFVKSFIDARKNRAAA